MADEYLGMEEDSWIPRRRRATAEDIRARIAQRRAEARSGSGRVRRTPAEEIGRGFHRAAGMVVGGAGAVGGLIADPLNRLLSADRLTQTLGPATSLRESARDLIDAPEPENAVERVTDAMGEGVAGAGPVIGLGRAIAARASGELARRVAAIVAEAPAVEAVGGAGSGLAQQLTAEAGYGPVAQTLAAVLGGGITGSAVALGSRGRGARAPVPEEPAIPRVSDENLFRDAIDDQSGPPPESTTPPPSPASPEFYNTPRGPEPTEGGAPVRNNFSPMSRAEREEFGYGEDDHSSFSDVYADRENGEIVAFDHHPSRPTSTFEYLDPINGESLYGTYNHETREFSYSRQMGSEGTPAREAAESAVEQAFDTLVSRVPGQRGPRPDPTTSAEPTIGRDLSDRQLAQALENAERLPPGSNRDKIIRGIEAEMGRRQAADPDSVMNEGAEPSSDGGGQQPPRDPPEPPRGGDEDPPEPPEPPRDGDGTDPPEPPNPLSVIERLTTALNAARRLGPAQRKKYAEERQSRTARIRGVRQSVSGEAGHRAELAELRGELPKVEFDPIRGEFTQPEIDSLFRMINDRFPYSVYDPIHARTGLTKLLEGALPTPSELDVLARVFPQDFIEAAIQNRSVMARLKDAAANTLNIFRPLMSSLDFSAPFRQGVFLVSRPEFYKAWGPMFREAWQELLKNDNIPEPSRGANWRSSGSQILDNIHADPNYHLMEEGGLSLTRMGRDLAQREEAFGSAYAEKIPGLGRLIRASNAGFTGFLNKLRADVFNAILERARAVGTPIDREFLKGLSRFINSATGRGSLGALNSSAPLLNGLFFSPRLIKSRVDLLNPVYYATLPPLVRREAAQDLLNFGAIATTIMGLAAAGGMNVEADPRSSDFGKLRDGNVRWDILGGFGQYITLGARLATNQTQTIGGEEQTLGERYGRNTRLDTALNFGINKFSPVASLVTDYLRGANPVGEEFSWPSALLSRVAPLITQNIYEVMQESGPIGAAQVAPAVFGVGVQVIPPRNTMDVYGRPVTENPAPAETDPTVIEIERLEEGPIGRARRNDLLVNGERRDLTDEEFQRYQELSGRYILEDMRAVMAAPGYDNLPDEDRQAVLRQVVRDQRRNAREELFSGAPQGDELIEAPTGPNQARPAQGGSQGPTGGDEYLGSADEGASIIREIFPGVEVTDNIRDPDSPLGRRNPSSRHIHSTMAVDVRPIPGMTFREYIRRIREAGYTIRESRDEVTNPVSWATGPHWHVEIGERR